MSTQILSIVTIQQYYKIGQLLTIQSMFFLDFLKNRRVINNC